jgi:hypothetical protein
MRGESATERRHLIDVPGGIPLEIEYRPGAACESCATSIGKSGDVVHSSDCPAARALAARAARDITTDGAAELADEARAVFAGDYADSVIDDDARVEALRSSLLAGDSDEDLAALRSELVLAHKSGFRQAEHALASMAMSGARRLREEIDQLISQIQTWLPPGYPEQS